MSTGFTRHDAVTTREPMQSNPRVRQRLGQRSLKPEALPPVLPSAFALFNFQRGQIFSCAQILGKDFTPSSFQSCN
jgi:hypothetical protein